MKLNMLIATPTIALAAGISLAACGSPSGSSGSSNAAPQSKTLTRIRQSNLGGDETIYNNYWSDGTATTCMVHVFPDGTQSASGNCAPDGVASEMTVPAGGGAVRVKHMS